MPQNRSDQASVALAFRNHENRIRALEGNAIIGAGFLAAVWGSLYNDGTIIAGTGFTVVWAGGSPSLYTITFTKAFANPPIAFATPNGQGGTDRVAAIVDGPSTTTTQLVVLTFDIDDPDSLTEQDAGFDFLALEPLT